MQIIDFRADVRQAFWRGFMKGLAAPTLLFTDFSPPPIPQARPVAPVAGAGQDVAASLAQDWRAIGDDLRRVIERHGEQAA